MKEMLDEVLQVTSIKRWVNLNYKNFKMVWTFQRLVAKLLNNQLNARKKSLLEDSNNKKFYAKTVFNGQ